MPKWKLPEEPAPAPAPAPSAKYTLAELQADCPADVSGTNKEDSLNDAEFAACIKMSRDDFRALPKWMRDRIKKDLKLF